LPVAIGIGYQSLDCALPVLRQHQICASELPQRVDLETNPKTCQLIQRNIDSSMLALQKQLHSFDVSREEVQEPQRSYSPDKREQVLIRVSGILRRSLHHALNLLNSLTGHNDRFRL